MPHRKTSLRVLSLLLLVLTACGGNPSGPGTYDYTGGQDSIYRGSLPPGEPWTQGNQEQALGFYAKGSLINATQLPTSGPGFQAANLITKNHFATYDLIAIVSVAARWVNDLVRNSDALRVGELSSQKGGRQSAHDSHQNGLDADLNYYKTDGRNHSEFEPDTMMDSVVVNGKLLSNFDSQRNYELIRGLVSSGRVLRIFMDPLVKKNLCAYAKQLGENTKINENLRVMQPYPGHTTHMHVRITCPQNSPRCLNQAPRAAATGC